MASFRQIFSVTRGAGRRLFSTQAGRTSSSRKLAVGAVSAVAAASAVYTAHKVYYQDISLNNIQPFGAVLAATSAPQPSVVSGTKEHALYLWIHLSPGADVKQCGKVVANLPAHVDAVCPPDLRDEEDEIWAGVAFGPNFIAKTLGKAPKNFYYPDRKGALGAMPSTGGDIFIHAKSNKYSKLYELSQRIIRQLPAGSVEKADDIYGWVYQNGRDLSGFIDGTENPADDDSRFDVAVDKANGSSYLITQKWVHRHDIIQKEKDKVKEGWVGRNLPDSTELSRKPATSHVARMTGGTNFQQKKVTEIVRQSQPFGTVTGESGLFFIAYAASPDNFEYMLDRMVGADKDGLSDDVMRLSECTQGTYWYVPSSQELARLK
ncbi:dye-decolorizing peroxidase YfeX-like [Glandiceps talaboti]